MAKIMGKNCIGIDIGASQVKISSNKHYFAEDIPDNLVRDGQIISPEVMSGVIKEALSKNKITTKKCAITLPSSVVYTRFLTIPAMTVEQLNLNLSYEFKDYITQEKDKYYYDYAVIKRIDGENKKPVEFELFAVAFLKETLAFYKQMLKRAGLSLAIAVPNEVSYMNLIKKAPLGEDGEPQEFCFLDLGHTETRMNIFKGQQLLASREISFSLNMLEDRIAEALNVDPHLAKTYLRNNNNDELSHEVCKDVYSQISIEVMRALNFYRYNNQESTLSKIHVCGGGAMIEPLITQIGEDSQLEMHHLLDILNVDDKEASMVALAIGCTLQ